jgi:hypothetical protein
MGEVKRGLKVFYETAVATLATHFDILNRAWRKRAFSCRYAIWVKVRVKNFDVYLSSLLDTMLTLTHWSHLWGESLRLRYEIF